MEMNLYRIINSILLAVIVILSLGAQIGIGQVTWYHCGLAFVIVVGLATFCYLKIKGRLLMGLSLLTFAGVTLFVVGRDGLAEFGQSYLAGLSGNADPVMEWGIWHESVQVLLISVGIFLFQLLLERLFGLKAAVAGVLLGMLFADLFTGRSLSHIAVVCVLTYVVIVFIEWTQRRWRKQRTASGKQYVVWIMPFLCLYFLLMLVMPAPDEPYDWQFVKDVYGRMRERYVTLTQNWQGRGKEDFDMVASGFSEDGRLLGGIADIGQEVMVIRGQQSLKTNVYLVGKVYDTFTGQQWLQSDESAGEDRLLDALETLYAIRSYDNEYMDNYIYSTKLQVIYKYFNTGYLFAPLKTWKVWSSVPYEGSGGNLLFEKHMGYGASYDVHFFQMNVDHIRFYEFMEAEWEEEETLWKNLQRDYVKNVEGRYSLAELKARREEIDRIYGQEIELSRETLDWLADATEGAGTDVEKLKAIESALADLEYSKTPGALPAEITSEGAFLDYFLTESRKGFCSYFASAFVLLARAEGIPARYVEGFCVPVEGGQETVVYSDMAHAWPEAYIEGVGWIPFEPTPGYERIRYTPWEMVDKKTNRPEGGIVTWEDLEEDASDTGAGSVSGSDAGDGDSAELAEEAEKERQRANVIRILLFTVLFALLAGFVAYEADGYLTKRRRRKWSLTQMLVAELQTNLQLLAALGYRRAENETLTELEGRAWAVMQCEKGLQFLRLYEDILYGEHAATEEMLLQVLAERKLLMEMLKKWKRLQYIYYKIVLHNKS